MAAHAFHTVDVFTHRPFTGNPLAVFPDGRGLSAQQMQLVAREINYSETVFVLPADKPGRAFRLRIFTPEEEIPFAGHPTIGTAWVLASIGRIKLTGERTRVVLEEDIGPVPVVLTQRNERLQRARLTVAKLPEEGPEPPPREQLAEALSLSPQDILGGPRRPRAFSCGNPFVFVPVRDVEALGRAAVDRRAWKTHLTDEWSQMLFLAVFDDSRPDAPIRARMFAPLTGVPEDPATGSAVAALAGYVAGADDVADGTHQWRVEQGVEMGRPSVLELTVDKQNGAITGVHVGGRAVMVASGEMTIPELE